jgi:hypothetical protein
VDCMSAWKREGKGKVLVKFQRAAFVRHQGIRGCDPDMGTGVGKNERMDQATERPVTGKDASDLDLGSARFPVTRDPPPNLWPI